MHEIIASGTPEDTVKAKRSYNRAVSGAGTCGPDAEGGVKAAE